MLKQGVGGRECILERGWVLLVCRQRIDSSDRGRLRGNLLSGKCSGVGWLLLVVTGGISFDVDLPSKLCGETRAGCLPVLTVVA